MATNTVPALTTVFTPAASCLTDIYNLTYSSGGSPWIYLQLGPTPTANDCYPSGFTPAPTAYYSPGICPSGYLMACSSIVNINSVSETRATCCPSAYTCQTDVEMGWPWYSTELCTLAATTTGTFTITAEPTATSTYIGTPKFNAYGIQIRWQLDYPPTKTSHTPTTTPQPTTKSQSVASSALSSPARSSGLSTGAKVGIGVGAGLGALVILIAVLTIFFCRRRKKATDSNAQFSNDYSSSQLKNPNLYQQGELDGFTYRSHPYELDSKVLPAELGSEPPYHP